jgi:cardiolipin synthase
VIEQRSGSAWTIPNALTVARIALTPAFVAAFVNERHLATWIIFALAGVTDCLDGFLARVLDQKSRLGAILDPIADKFLLNTAFICLGLADLAPSWLAVLVVTRDVIILGGYALLMSMGVNLVGRLAPSWLSKVTTAVQILLVLYLLTVNAFEWKTNGFAVGLCVLAAGLTFLSGAQYVRQGLQYVPHHD